MKPNSVRDAENATVQKRRLPGPARLNRRALANLKPVRLFPHLKLTLQRTAPHCLLGMRDEKPVNPLLRRETQTAQPEAGTGTTVIQKAKSPARYANAGSITLGAAALICVVLGAVQGFIPIFLIEGVAFAGLAWLCAAKWPLGQSLHSVVLVGSLLLAGLAGVSLDQDTFGPRYRYLSQGSVQYRVDEKAGRTERLGNHGWYPVAFDSEAKEINALDAILTVNLTKGYWEPAIAGGDICFTVSNSSGYILDRITIQVQTQKKNDANAGKGDASALNQQIVLKSYGGGLIGTGDTVLACASSPRDLGTDETWSYSDVHIYGWKR